MAASTLEKVRSEALRLSEAERAGLKATPSGLNMACSS